MNLKIIEKKEQPVLGRVHITAVVGFEAATPSNADISKELSKQLKVEEGLVVVKHIYTEFGLHNADIEAVAYKNVESKTRYTLIAKKVRKAEAKAKFDGVRAKAAEKKAAAEAKPAEA